MMGLAVQIDSVSKTVQETLTTVRCVAGCSLTCVVRGQS